MPNKHKKKPFAKKSLGQNFLVDQNIINIIISSLNVQKDETVIEIGAGRGALTRFLIEKTDNLIAIEIDRDLIPILQDNFSYLPNFKLIEEDALEIDFEELISLNSTNKSVKLVANLPYYISTAILQHLIKSKKCFSEMILMLQKEVVDRITAEPGSKERGFLSVLIQANFETEKLLDVSPNSFRPKPKVVSSVMRLITNDSFKITIKDPDFFRDLVSCGFQQKRKTIQNNLKNSGGVLKELIKKNGGIIPVLEKLQIDGRRRAETLTIDEWSVLSNFLYNP